MTDKTYDLTYLSFGAGVQSSALLAASNLGLHGVPKADIALFADTGHEPAYVYQQLRFWQEWSKIPVEIVHHKERKSFALPIPAFTSSETGDRGILRRQCTNGWKILPLESKVRELLGYKPRQRIKKRARALIGISLDEAHRMKPSFNAWTENHYPLVDARLRRNDCLKIIQELGLPKPERSACYFCPFHSDAEWRFLRDKHPEEWARAVDYDIAMRNSTAAGGDRPVFLHSTLIPLGEVGLDRPENPLFPEVDAFGNDCTGLCGV